MSQATTVLPTTGPLSAASYSALVNLAFAAVLSGFSGTVAPSTTGYPVAYQRWVDTSFTPARDKMYTGSTWALRGMVDAVAGVYAHAGPPTQTSTAARTGVLTDANKRIEFNSTISTPYTIPSSTTVLYPLDTFMDVIRKGTGAVSIAPLTTAMTINGSTLTQTLTKQYGKAQIYQSSLNAWIATGDIST